ISRTQLEHEMSPSGQVSKAVSADLDRGCIGLCAAYQGRGQKFPEEASGTKAYLSEAEARARTVGNGETNFVFGKQGQWKSGQPVPDNKTGEVPIKSISSNGGHYNYVTTFPSTHSYAWMSNGVYPGS